MGKLYELIVFSSMSIKFTSAIVQHIENKIGKIFSFVLSIEECMVASSMVFLKNLDLLSLNRDMENIVCLDSNIYNYSLHTNHIIPLSTFKLNRYDQDVIKLMEYLKRIALSHDSAIITIKKSIILTH